MRVISGKYKGKNLIGFDIDGTRPTMDRVKESLFGSIQSYIKNSVVLDLFAGSGSLGIEAISNGAKVCYFSDKNKELIKIIEKNVIGFDDEIHIMHDDYNDVLNNLKEINFDVIFLDPPYKLNLINDCINIITQNKLLNQDGIIVCEYETENIEFDKKIYKIIKYKKYGSKKILILKKM